MPHYEFMTAYREHFWNIGPERQFLYLLVLAFLAFSLWGFSQHYRRWRLGRAESRRGHYAERLRSVYYHAIKHNTILEDTYAGVMHLLIFSGFGVLFAGTALTGADYWLDRLFGLSFLRGPFYLGYSLILDLAGLALLLGVGLAAYRRYIVRPLKLDNLLEDGVILAGLTVIAISGFLVEGLRLAITEVWQHPDWAMWSPIGLATAWGWLALGLEEDQLLGLHGALWWAHVALSFGGLNYLFYSKLSHILLAPVNIYLRPFGPRGALTHIPDIASSGSAGVKGIRDFTWKQLFDLDACTRCGRCQENCPAWLAGTPLSPKKLIQDLKAHWWQRGGALLSSKTITPLEPLAGSVIADEVLWACTTCRACHSRCPVMIEFVDKIIDLRRHLASVQKRLPAGLQEAHLSLNAHGHPWPGTPFTRSAWAQDLGVKVLSKVQRAPWLLWVGCTGALVASNITSIRALARVLAKGGIDFTILGDEEVCCGHPARRMGDERLFRLQAQRNIETFRRYGVQRIVTACPHCYNTIKYEYPQLNGEFEVWHHTELLAKLLQEGSLRPRGHGVSQLTYHDPCYLGRHNRIYSEPRAVLASATDSLVELPRRQGWSFCCGAGGGGIWLSRRGAGINRLRVQEILTTGVPTLATACPFCLQMLRDGVMAEDAQGRLMIRDIAEILDDAF